MISWDEKIVRVEGSFPDAKSARIALAEITMDELAEVLGTTRIASGSIIMPTNPYNDAFIKVVDTYNGAEAQIYSRALGASGGSAIYNGFVKMHTSWSYSSSVVTVLFKPLLNGIPSTICYQAYDGFPFVVYNNRAMLPGGVNHPLYDLSNKAKIKQSTIAPEIPKYCTTKPYDKSGPPYPELLASSIPTGICGLNGKVYYSAQGTLIQLIA